MSATTIFDLAVMADLQAIWTAYAWFRDVSPLARYGGAFLLMVHVLVTTTWARIQPDKTWREKCFVTAQRSLLTFGSLIIGGPFIFSAGAFYFMKRDHYEMATLCLILAKIVPAWDAFYWTDLVAFFFPVATKSLIWKIFEFCFNWI